MPIYREAKRLASGRSAQPAAQPDTREAEITEDNTSKECNKRYHHHNVTASYMCATVALKKRVYSVSKGLSGSGYLRI
jgi:hypothetical protein